MEKRTNAALLILLVTLLSGFSGALSATEMTWKVGLSKAVITPRQSMWLAGYATRDKPSTGTMHDLWAKAIVLEDAKGKLLLCISTDLVGIPRSFEQRFCEKLQHMYGLRREQILINSSHTHSGPVLTDALEDIYQLNATEKRKLSPTLII